MAKNINIGGVEFKVSSKCVEYNKYMLCGRTLYDCYNRPSLTKENIWNYWLNWALETPNVYDLGVRGYNCHFFSLDFRYVDENGTEWYGIITHARHEICLLNY